MRMMNATAVVRLPAPARIAIFLAISVNIVLYFYVAEDPFHKTQKFINLHPQAPQSNATSPIDAFDFPPPDSEAIRSICADTEWNPALIRTSVKTDMGYMLDPAHFRESLRISCPGKKVYDRIEELKGKLFHDQIALLPESLEEKVPSTGLAAQRSGGNLLTPGSASTSSLHQREPDGANFALAFGKLLKFRAGTRLLATKTLLALAANASYSPNLSQPILPDFFFGAHLRTEHDAQLGWPAEDWVYSRYETQAKFYLKETLASGLKREEVAKFAQEAAEKNITVSTKIGVLGAEDVAQLEALSWDQQGMVDFLVMLGASRFAGVGHSSFAWNVALVRHLFAQQKGHLKGPHLLNDELSEVYGYPKQYPEYASCLWP
ncbi:hypothetical protein VE04_07338 [Pseudogymnoascus sp. 24MN13]|nr:hypothetical protein VE04_07338 [Pseudogymnoascus sp. 24MN13]